MKSASSQTRTEFILYDVVNGSQSAPLARVQYDDDLDGVFSTFDDVESFSLSKSNVNKQYGRFILVPPTSTFSANFDNRAGKYSPDSGGEFDGVLQRNLLIRAKLGYEINDDETSDYNFDETSALIAYHTQTSAGQIKNNITLTDAYTALPGITETWNFYGSGTYGSGTYSPEGYWLSTVLDAFDLEIYEYVNLKFTSDTNKIAVYWRHSARQDDLTDNLTTFEYLGMSSSGANTFPISTTDDYVQFCFVFQTGVWGTGYIENVLIENVGNEFFTQGQYLVDDPTFSSSFGSYKASFSARDKFKKAFETAISLPDFTGQDVAIVLRAIADRAGIPHNSSGELIPSTGYTVTISGSDFVNVKAIDAMNEAMLYLYYKNSNYRLELSDAGYLQLVIKDDSALDADWVLDYRYNLFSLSKKYLSDKLAQRFTFATKEFTVNAETTLATATYTTTGQKTLSWSGYAEYKRIDIVRNTGDDSTITLDAVNNESVVLTINGTVNVTITVYGDKINGAYTGYVGEALSLVNQNSQEGFTQKIINRFIQSDAEAKAMSEAFIAEYGSPAYETSVTLPMNPLLELGDKLLIWEKYTNTKTIYRIESISINWNSSGAKCTMSLQLQDLGVEFTNFNWDRHNIINGGTNSGTNDALYDSGLLWDQDLGPLVASDTNTYSNKVRAS